MKYHYIITSICLLLLGNISKAQFQVGGNANVLIPLSPTSIYYKSGVGGGIVGKYLFESKFALGGFFNYNFLSPSSATFGATFTMMNYGASMEYNFFEDPSTPYLGVDFGQYRFRTNISGFSQGFSGTNFNFDNYTSLGIAPNIGYILSSSDLLSFNFNFKYHQMLQTAPQGFNYQFIQLTAGIIFTLGER